jgi:hypothetical protein
MNQKAPFRQAQASKLKRQGAGRKDLETEANPGLLARGAHRPDEDNAGLKIQISADHSTLQNSRVPQHI